MLTVLDIETTSNGPDRSPSFYWFKNSIVSVGWDTGGTNGYACIKHNTKSAHPKTREKLQYILDNTILLKIGRASCRERV